MAEQHQQMQQQHPHQGQQQHITAQILNVQGGVATLDDSVPVQIMMPSTVVMEDHHHHQQVQEQHHPVQVPQHVQEMQEAVIQEAVGSAHTSGEDPKIANKKELSKQWKSLCKKAKQWCGMHDDSIPNFVMMYLDENRLVWEGPDHMESFISDESVISAFLRTSALSESLIGMEKRGVDDAQDVPRPAKKQKKPEAPPQKKGMTDDEVIASILEKPEAEMEDAARDEQAGGDDDHSDVDTSQPTEGEPSQSTSAEGQPQGGEGDVLSQVIESVIKDWAPGQGPPRTEEEGDGNVPDETSAAEKMCKPSVSLIRGSAMSKPGKDAAPLKRSATQGLVLPLGNEGSLEDIAIEPEFLCACGIVLPNKRLFLEHYNTKHTGPKPFQCQVCEKNFSTGKRLKGHMALHTDGNQKIAIPDGKRRFMCPDCPLSLSTMLGLQYHMNKKHGKTLDKNAKANIRNVRCVKCSLTFRSLGELRRHARNTHFLDKKFACEHCGEKFRQKSMLRKHLKAVHRQKPDGGNDEKCASRQPCVCEQCGKTLSSRRSLKMHMLWVHQGVKPFPCPHCPRQFCQRRDLDHHINITHGSAKLLKIEVDGQGRRVVLGRGKHVCNICSREFSGARPLKVHMRIHTGEKPFSCDTCSRPFARKSDLVKHMRLHTGEKPYECPVCHKMFRAISNMKLHARKACGYDKFGPYIPPEASTTTHMSNIEIVDVKDIEVVDVKSEGNEGDVFIQLAQEIGRKEKDVEQIEVTYETEGNVIPEGHVIQQIEGSPGSYQVIIPADVGTGALTTIDLQDISQAVASAAEYTEQGRQVVYVNRSMLHGIPTTSVSEPSSSEIHMAADTIAKIEAIHNAQISRDYQS